jgi:hypothetical protein
MKMSERDYSELLEALDDIFNEVGITRVTLNIEAEDGRCFAVDCAPVEPPQPPILH